MNMRVWRNEPCKRRSENTKCSRAENLFSATDLRAAAKYGTAVETLNDKK